MSQVHGFGWRWLPVHVRIGILLRGAVAADGVARHRNASLWGLPMPGTLCSSRAHSKTLSSYLFSLDVGHDSSCSSRKSVAQWFETVPNDAHLFRHVFQPGKISWPRTKRSVRLPARSWLWKWRRNSQSMRATAFIMVQWINDELGCRRHRYPTGTVTPPKSTSCWWPRKADPTTTKTCEWCPSSD